MHSKPYHGRVAIWFAGIISRSLLESSIPFVTESLLLAASLLFSAAACCDSARAEEVPEHPASRPQILLAQGNTASRSAASPAAKLKVDGCSSVNPPVAEAAELLRSEQRIGIEIDTQGGSSGGLALLGEGLVDVAMSSRPVDDTDRKKFPKVSYTEITIGKDAVSLVVSRDVWDGGVHFLTKQQIRDIYEGKIDDWSAVGGKKQRIVFFNREPGRGTWVVFVDWLYGSIEATPAADFPEAGGDYEARAKVVSTRGGVTELTTSLADGKSLFALGVKGDDGSVIEPTPANIASRRFPICRSLNLITNGEPRGDAKTLVEFMLSERGQALVQKHGSLRNCDITR